MKRTVILMALLLACCSKGHVQVAQGGYAGALPPPVRVVVADFTVTPDEVQLDSGISARLLRSQGDEFEADLQMQAAQATQAALGETLAARLASYGLNVQRQPDAAGAEPPGTLLVQGRILSIDQGNRTRRTLVGLGAGKSSVTADAQLYYVSGPAQPRYLQTMSGSANSGHMPGAAETMGAGAAAQHLARSAVVAGVTHAGAEARRTADEDNADKLAVALAKQIGEYAVGQGWIPASALR